jgi:hypothetical protein
MKRIWGLFLVYVLVLAFFVNVGLAAAEQPEVLILPNDKIVSVDSPVVIKVDPKTTTMPMRITWSVYNTGNIGMGSFPIQADGKGLCYFSNSDGNATCGPSPFFQQGETEFYVFVVTSSGITNRTVYMNISPATIPVDGVDRVDNTVFMYINMGKKDFMKYSIYKEDLTIYQSDRPLDYDVSDGRYEGNITLNAGTYYFAFLVNASGTYGSAMKRIEIPSGDYLTIQTLKGQYWTGEKIKMTGTTSSNYVSGEVRFPDGTKALDFSADAGSNHLFSYEFYSKSNWPEGIYQIVTSKPLAKSANFTLTEFFELSPEAVTATVNKSSDFTTSLRLKNIRTNTTNVSIVVTGGMKYEYVTIADAVLSPQETTTITITIPNVETALTGNIVLKTPEDLELSVPVTINVAESLGPCTGGGGKALEIAEASLVWSQECMVDDEMHWLVNIKNNGASPLSDFTYEIKDTYSGMLEDLDRMKYIEIPLANLSIAPGETKEIDVKLTAASASKYQGILTFKSGAESASMFVSLNCYDNISEDIADLGSRLAKLSISDDTKEDITSDISNAESSISLGNYALANEYYVRAKAKMDMVEAGATPSGQPMDMTTIIIIVVVIIAVVGVLLFFRMRKSRVAGMEEGQEEEIESFR